ncbi:MAG: lytic transglycosylase domain-containing protein [Burkholderiaceae bacterium]|nr:lytic transglycosylase domain-containing protein [Burkholderiaceae bacterium]
MTAPEKTTSGLRTFFGDVSTGFLHIIHSGFALLGLAVAVIAIALVARPNLRQTGEEQLIGWLQERQAQVIALANPLTPEPESSERALAVNPKSLPKEQATVAYWLSKRYRVAPEPLGLLVSEAYETGARVKLDPTLILAVMAIESKFNPFAQSSMGAQGLMQVMTRVHTDKYDDVGGKLAAFDPVTNLRVGVRVLQECIVRAGSIEGGLRCYVGAANQPSDGGYAAKVLAEHLQLRQVAGGRRIAPSTPAVSAMPVTPVTPRVILADTATDSAPTPAAQPTPTLQTTPTTAPASNEKIALLSSL